jgi:hypothetical protein
MLQLIQQLLPATSSSSLLNINNPAELGEGQGSEGESDSVYGFCSTHHLRMSVLLLAAAIPLVAARCRQTVTYTTTDTITADATTITITTRE